MTYGVYACGEFATRRNHSFRPTTGSLLRSLVLVLGGALAVALVYVNVADLRDDEPQIAEDPANAVVAARWPDVFANLYDPLRDSSISLGAPPTTFADRMPSPSTFHATGAEIAAVEPPAKAQPDPVVTLAVVETVPLPRARPSEPHIIANRGPSKNAPLTTSTVLAAAPADQRNFLEKFFGIHKPTETGPQLAYASPDGGLSGVPMADTPAKLGSDDRTTAVYDISAHTVYLPDGRRLEAHSGLGSMLDDPRHVAVRMHGPTPPHIYSLKLRESLFHGVKALRLTPVGDGDIYGRTGLLAHTYMLGPNGDSNGCVSFKDYDAFLRAYENGEIKRLMVVASANQVVATAEPQSRSSPR
jgi:hypothetical protein